MSTDFGADSSSHFPFRGETKRQTRLNALPHAGGITAGVGNDGVDSIYSQQVYQLNNN